MIRITADTLSFLFPESWADVTTAQALALPTVTGTRDTFLLLSGLSAEQLRPLRAPDLDALVSRHLSFLNQPPTFAPLSAPAPIVFGATSINPPTNLGTDTTIAQKWDVDDAIKALTPPAPDGDPDAPEPTVGLLDVARPLLSIYLAPLVNSRPYTGDSDAAECWHTIQHLPCTDLLPLAAFFLSKHYQPISSGRLSSVPMPSPTTPTRPWPKKLFSVLTSFRRTRPSVN